MTNLELVNEMNLFFNMFDLPTLISSAGQTESPLITCTSAPIHAYLSALSVTCMLITESGMHGLKYSFTNIFIHIHTCEERGGHPTLFWDVATGLGGEVGKTQCKRW